MHRLQQLRSLQGGVVARTQAVAAGLTDTDLRRLRRRRDLVVIHPGVYVDHTGEPTWLQRAWAAVLHGWPAALFGESALRAWDGPGRRNHSDTELIHIAVDRNRHVVPPPGVVVHRVANLDEKTQWNLGPPRLRIEEAVIDVTAEATDELAAVGVLSDAIGSRRTTAGRLAAAVAGRSRISRRPFLTAVIRDLEDGTCSVLEHGYLRRVERAHGLPRARRQVAAQSRGRIFRDVLYEEFGQIIELDGRLDHTGAEARDRDLERDLDAAVDGLAGVRIGWGQVFLRPCLTAQRVAALLRRRGWTGVIQRCPDCP